MMIPIKHLHLACVVAVAFMLLGYFSYHGFEGKRGWWAFLEIQADVQETKDELAALRQERAALENRIRRLRDDTIDPDLLDEVARQMLGYAAPDDVVVLAPRDDAEANHDLRTRKD